MWTQSEQVENDDDDDVPGDLAVEAFGNAVFSTALVLSARLGVRTQKLRRL